MLFAFYYTFLDLLLSSNYSVFGSCSFEVILWRLLLGVCDDRITTISNFKGRTDKLL